MIKNLIWAIKHLMTMQLENLSATFTHKFELSWCSDNKELKMPSFFCTPYQLPDDASIMTFPSCSSRFSEMEFSVSAFPLSFTLSFFLCNFMQMVTCPSSTVVKCLRVLHWQGLSYRICRTWKFSHPES